MAPIILPRISDQKPLVSVVSITYNHEPYIRDCLEGFLMQKTDFPVEIIIHDDASTDHTADIIREYYEKRPDLFHVIIERENQYSQHKKIMTPLYKQAKGKYIALCEGDDYWTDPLKLQKQFDILERNSDYIGVVHRFDVVNKQGTPENIETFGYYEKKNRGIYTLYDFEKDTHLPSHVATLMFKNIFRGESNKIIYPECLEKNLCPGDMKLFFLLLLHGNIYRLKDKMSAYRYVREKGGNSWTSRRIGNCNPYQTWINIKDLEYIAKGYQKELDFRKRKLDIESTFIIVAIKKRNLAYMKHLIQYLVFQKQALAFLPKTIIELTIEFCKRLNK